MVKLENVSIVVEDLEATIAFFTELGLVLEGQGQVEAPWADRISGIDGQRLDVAMMRAPDGDGRLELMKFLAPTAVRADPENAPVNTLGIRRVLFAVEDLEDVLARLRKHGAELLGEVTPVEDSYLFCYLRGPEGIIVALVEQLNGK